VEVDVDVGVEDARDPSNDHDRVHEHEVWRSAPLDRGATRG
jgi:hypothetical protein